MQTGDYKILIGKSSRDIVCGDTVTIQSTKVLPAHYDENSLFGDLMADEKARKILEPYMAIIGKALGGDPEDENSAAKEAISKDMEMAMLRYMPLRGVRSFCGDAMTEDELKEILKKLQAQ